MTATEGSDLAFRVADRVRANAPWDVFAERLQRYEIHLNGRSVEMVRGPILLEGYALRLLEPRDGKVAVGFQASSDLTDEGVRAAVDDAAAVARHSEFPAARLELPNGTTGPSADVAIRDERLWDRPLESLDGFVASLLAEFEGKKEIRPTFGSVRATLTEVSVANSAGLRSSFAHTTVDFEIAVQSFGGPEGAPPGEYWVNESRRRLEPEELSGQVDSWCRFAQDVRRAKATPAGDLPVVLPPSIVATILPGVLGSRFTGAARLSEIAPEPGVEVGAAELTVLDDGLVPWALGSSPVDSEGVPQRRRTLIDGGQVNELLYDVLHAGAFGARTTGSAVRDASWYRDWKHFLHRPAPQASTIAIRPGTGGTDEELVEAAQDGLWVQQLGWAVPDPISTAFGGEVRIGYRIRNGKLAEPVRGGTVGGTVLTAAGTPSMLHNLAGIGTKPRLEEALLSPTLLVRSLTVAGA